MCSGKTRLRAQTDERRGIASLHESLLDLSQSAGHEKEQRSHDAMRRGEPLIYGGRMQVYGLLGDPDLLRKSRSGYIARHTKSGTGEEGPEDNSRPKVHYPVIARTPT